MIHVVTYFTHRYRDRHTDSCKKLPHWQS